MAISTHIAVMRFTILPLIFLIRFRISFNTYKSPIRLIATHVATMLHAIMIFIYRPHIITRIFFKTYFIPINPISTHIAVMSFTVRLFVGIIRIIFMTFLVPIAAHVAVMNITIRPLVRIIRISVVACRPPIVITRPTGARPTTRRRRRLDWRWLASSGISQASAIATSWQAFRVNISAESEIECTVIDTSTTALVVTGNIRQRCRRN